MTGTARTGCHGAPTGTLVGLYAALRPERAA